MKTSFFVHLVLSFYARHPNRGVVVWLAVVLVAATLPVRFGTAIILGIGRRSFSIELVEHCCFATEAVAVGLALLY